jgi:hypothetical protein
MIVDETELILTTWYSPYDFVPKRFEVECHLILDYLYLIENERLKSSAMMTGMSPAMSLKAVIERHATGWNRNAEADMPVWIGSKKFGIMATNGA